VFVSVGNQRTGGGHSQHWVVCPGCFHSVHGPGRHSLNVVAALLAGSAGRGTHLGASLSLHI